MHKLTANRYRAGLSAFWAIAVVFTLCTPAHAQSSLTPHTAEYRIKISVLGGKLNTELRATDTGYVAQHVVRPTGFSKIIASGSISETSEFEAAPDGIRPTRYHSEDTLSNDKTRADLSFDWDSLRAYGTVNDQDVESFFEELAYDRVSIQYELMHDLLRDGPSEKYLMFDVDELKIINVRNIGQKKVRVPAGEFEAVGIQHQREGSSRVTTLWCVAELGYLPVLIEQHRRGKLRVRATLKNYTPITT